MKEVLLKELGTASASVEFIDHVPFTEIPSYLAKATVCAFPSLWENFPNVCLEAMAAARGIVASRSGGMAEMIGKCNGGLLVDPHNVKEIVNAITYLLQHDEERIAYGKRSRELIVNYFSGSITAKLLEQYKGFAEKKKNVEVKF